MNKRLFNLTVIIALIIGISGCATYSKDSATKTSALLEPAATMKFNDLPVPAGFRLLPQDSYSFETVGVRVGVLRYQGKADPDQVINFYKEQMSMYNWQLLNVIEFGQRLLNFERETETCNITLTNKGNLVTITASIGPKAKLMKKTNMEPLK